VERVGQTFAEKALHLLLAGQFSFRRARAEGVALRFPVAEIRAFKVYNDKAILFIWYLPFQEL
jgi:hypothetical protein